MDNCPIVTKRDFLEEGSSERMAPYIISHILFFLAYFHFRISYSLLATPCPLASWYQFYCLVNKNPRELVTCPELLIRKLVVSVIEPATLRSPGPFLNHTTTENKRSGILLMNLNEGVTMTKQEISKWKCH